MIKQIIDIPHFLKFGNVIWGEEDWVYKGHCLKLLKNDLEKQKYKCLVIKRDIEEIEVTGEYINSVEETKLDTEINLIITNEVKNNSEISYYEKSGISVIRVSDLNCLNEFLNSSGIIPCE